VGFIVALFRLSFCYRVLAALAHGTLNTVVFNNNNNNNNNWHWCHLISHMISYFHCILVLASLAPFFPRFARTSKCVRAGQSSSRSIPGVLQWRATRFCSGTITLSVYTSPISFIVSYLGISLQQYADDTQLYISVSVDDLTVHLNPLESCLQSLHLWLCHNGLALNSGKSESILFSTPSRIRHFPSVSGVNIAGTLVPISDKIVTLGVTLDRHSALSHHTSNVCRAAYFHIHAALRHIRPSLTEDMAITVAVSMVHSRLDYAKSLVHGHANVKILQFVQNSAGRVVLKDNHHLSSGDLLCKLHWLPVQSRVEFKIACITYKVLTTGQPSYLINLLNRYTPPRTLRSATFCSTRGFPLSLPRGRSVISHLKCGTTCPSILGFALPYQPSNVISKRTCLNRIYTSLPPSSSPSDCLRLRFSMFADIVRLTNACIIIIIIMSVLYRFRDIISYFPKFIEVT